MRIRRHKMPSILCFIEVVIGVYFLIQLVLFNRLYIHEYNEKLIAYRPGTSAIGMTITEDNSSFGMHLNDKWVAKRFVKAVKSKNCALTELNYTSSKQTNPYLGVDYKYFSLFKLELKCGRYFTKSENNKAVCLIGEQLAIKYFGSPQNSIGKKMKDKFLYNTYICRKSTDDLVKKPLVPTIVGVLKKDKKIPAGVINFDNGSSVKDFEASTDRCIIYPLSQKSEFQSAGLLSRTIWLKGNGMKARNIIIKLSSFKEYFSFKINPQPLSISSENDRDIVMNIIDMNLRNILRILIVVFGVSCIQLIAIKKRKFEIGLSIAFGARKRDIIKIILADSLFKIFIPAIAAFIASYYIMTKHILNSTNMIFDLYSYLGIIFAIVIFIILTSIIPAYYALNIDVIKVINKSKE